MWQYWSADGMIRGMAGSLYTIYHALRQHFGALYGAAAVRAWWPIFGADAEFEMVVGAVLVQQTRWEAVEQAIVQLRDAGLLTPALLAEADVAEVALLIRPVAFYTQKAQGLIAISNYLCNHYSGSCAALLTQATEPLRQELLALPRIGPESADVILLYGGRHCVFVVDEYTRRMLERVNPVWHTGDYGATRDWARARYMVVRERLEYELHHPPDLPVDSLQHFYADYHALINELCVRYCLARRPRCDGPPSRRVYSIQEGRNAYLHRNDGCPLRGECALYRAQAAAPTQ